MACFAYFPTKRKENEALALLMPLAHNDVLEVNDMRKNRAQNWMKKMAHV